MNHVFASSHLPEDNRPEEEEEDDVQPMLRAGGVRALSHLQQRLQGEPAAPRPTAPAYIPAWITEALHAEHQPGLETGTGSHGDFESPAIAHSDGVTGLHAVRNPLTLLNSHPIDPRGGMLPEHAVQQPQHLSGDQVRLSSGSRSGSPGTPSTDTPPEPSTRGAAEGQRSDSWGDRPPETRPDSSTATTGRGLDGRGTSEALFPQHGLGATGPSPQQRLQESQRAIAALKERVRGANPQAQGGRLGAQPQSPPQAHRPAADLAQNVSAAPQSQKQGQLPAPQNADVVKKSSSTDPSSQVPKTTIRIGNYPGFEKANPDKSEMDEWNTAFRKTYGTLAVEAAKKNGVPARLLAALSANEMAAENWNALHAFADRNTLATKSVGPLQIALKTALRYKLVPIDNEFYGASQADRWTALHDPDVWHGQPSPPSGLTPGQRLSSYRDNPHPNNPGGTKIVHDYLDNPTTGFDVGAKLLKIYLQRLVDDRKSGAYLKYSKDFGELTRLSSPDDQIHRDLNTLASGDKEAIHNLHFSAGLAKAIAMMWNNGEDIVNVENIGAQSPNASKHATNMDWQYDYQDDLIPPGGTQP